MNSEAIGMADGSLVRLYDTTLRDGELRDLFVGLLWIALTSVVLFWAARRGSELRRESPTGP